MGVVLGVVDFLTEGWLGGLGYLHNVVTGRCDDVLVHVVIGVWCCVFFDSGRLVECLGYLHWNGTL